MLCPNCQQDTLLKGKEKLVCINCGYSQDAQGAAKAAVNQSAVAEQPVLATVAAKVSEVSKPVVAAAIMSPPIAPPSVASASATMPPVAVVPAVAISTAAPAAPPIAPRATANPSATDSPTRPTPVYVKADGPGDDRMIVPHRDTKLAVKRKLTEVLGKQKTDLALDELHNAQGAVNEFASTYKSELIELLHGPVGKALIVIGAVLGIGLVGMLAFTFLR